MLISVHIPKTGGTAFGVLLQRHFGDELLLDYDDRPLSHGAPARLARALLRMPGAAATLHGFRAVHGHFLPLKYTLARNADIVTWLREPAQRIVSRYHHHVREVQAGALPRPGSGLRPGMSLAEFVEVPRFQDTYAKYLRGVPFSRIAAFCFSEDMPEGLERLRRKLGLDLGEAVRARTNPGRPDEGYEIDPRLRARIERLNRGDYRIWHRACDRDRR